MFSTIWGDLLTTLHRKPGTNLRASICGFLRVPAVFCGGLRKSAVFCENLRFPNAMFSRRARICKNRRLGSVCPLRFVPLRAPGIKYLVHGDGTPKLQISLSCRCRNRASLQDLPKGPRILKILCRSRFTNRAMTYYRDPAVWTSFFLGFTGISLCKEGFTT